jgi:hypothetical protein
MSFDEKSLNDAVVSGAPALAPAPAPALVSPEGSSFALVFDVSAIII